MNKGLKVEISPALVARDVEFWIDEGKLCTIPRETAEKMGLPPYATYVTATLSLTHIKQSRR
jgi:hypothetical protein